MLVGVQRQDLKLPGMVLFVSISIVLILGTRWCSSTSLAMVSQDHFLSYESNPFCCAGVNEIVTKQQPSVTGFYDSVP